MGVKPAVIIVKRTDTSSNWQYNDANDFYLLLNSTAASAGANRNGGWIPQYNTTATTLTTQNFSGNSNVNEAGGTYVAYLFAHNAGGFGLTGADNVISCGSFTTDSSSNATVNLGYEPQWVLYKVSSASGYDWGIIDNMRAYSLTSGRPLNANTSAAESQAFNGTFAFFPTATGFQSAGGLPPSQTFIYIAIRRGPMKVPTTGTSVFSPLTRTGTGSAATVTNIGFPPDMVLSERRLGPEGFMANRLAGFSNAAAQYLFTPYTSAEFAATTSTSGIMLDGTTTGTASLTSGSSNLNINGNAYIDYFMRRAPGFFDEVCYTGTGVTNRTVTHNLAAAPQMLFVKARSNAQNWSALCTLNSGLQGRLNANDALSAPSAAVFGNGTSYVAPTSSVFTVGTDNETNASGWTYVAYLFASCPGVSKVGSYTGDGTDGRVIDCGFTSGARFILIKTTSTTGNWWVWDSARGIVSGNDPRLNLNTTNAEATNGNDVGTTSVGFTVNYNGLAAINESGWSYIFLAIA